MISQKYSVFGWVIYHVKVSAGEQFRLRTKQATEHSRLSAQTIYTKGLITGHQEGDEQQLACTRSPGFGNDLLPNPVPAATMQMTVQEDAEWWCISVPENRTLPSVQYIRLQQGESTPVPVGSLIFVCEGRANFSGVFVEGPKSVRAVNASELLAESSSVYALRLDREKEE